MEGLSEERDFTDFWGMETMGWANTWTWPRWELVLVGVSGGALSLGDGQQESGLHRVGVSVKVCCCQQDGQPPTSERLTDQL